MDRLLGVLAPQNQIGTVTEFIAELFPTQRFFRMAARDIVAPLDNAIILEPNADARAHLIVAQLFQFIVDVKRHAFHQFDDFFIAYFAQLKLGDAGLAFDDA